MTENSLDAGTKAGAWAGGNSDGTWWYLTGTRGWPIRNCGSRGHATTLFSSPPALHPEWIDLELDQSHSPCLTFLRVLRFGAGKSCNDPDHGNPPRSPLPSKIVTFRQWAVNQFRGSQVHCRSFTRHTALFSFFCALCTMNDDANGRHSLARECGEFEKSINMAKTPFGMIRTYHTATRLRSGFSRLAHNAKPREKREKKKRKRKRPRSATTF